ncbi:MAG: hypothetical protein GY795_21255 [Desulfobacterales bacterium]|nr:hypothetical protein [Desulfobacterales bacterium]
MMKKWNRRERYAVFFMVIFLCITGISMFVVSPFIEKRKVVKRKLKAKTNTLYKMLVLKSEYDALKKKGEIAEKRISKRPKNFKLNIFLNDLTSRTGIKDNVEHMKPSKSEQKNSQYKLSIVDMKLKGITLKKLTPFLYKIETSKNMIFIKRLSITKKRRNEGVVDAVLQVETFET